jgi:hypothetical protein
MQYSREWPTKFVGEVPIEMVAATRRYDEVFRDQWVPSVPRVKDRIQMQGCSVVDGVLIDHDKWLGGERPQKARSGGPEVDQSC